MAAKDGDDIFSESKWGPPPPVPRALWDRSQFGRVPHRRNKNLRQSRDLTVAEEHYAVEEALRQETVTLWREMYQRMTKAEARVEELEAELRHLRMNPSA